MARFNIFSKRNNKKTKDVFTYDNIPQEFRAQVIHLWADAMGIYRVPERYSYRNPPPCNEVWEMVVKILCKEYGIFKLSSSNYDNPFEQCEAFIQSCDDEKVIDIVEITFKSLDHFIREYNQYQRQECGISQPVDDAIEELNDRFKEHGLGYQYVEGSIIRVDSEFLHQETIKPIIHLLHDEKFKGTEEEFFKAHEHYLHKRNKEAINECLKAFESCLKEICTRKKWSFPPKATASALLKIVIEDNKLIPQELTAHFTGLRSTLEAGVPTVRNNTSGHGQGEKPTRVPSYLVAYTLNITASAMLLLVNAYKEKK